MSAQHTPPFVSITPGMAKSYALVLDQVLTKVEDKFLRAQLRNLRDELNAPPASVCAGADEIALVVGALENFVKQWNACGPNSDFGRYFGATYMQACQALATLNSVPCEDCNGRGNTGETIYSSDPFQPPEAEQCGTCYGTGRISLKD